VDGQKYTATITLTTQNKYTFDAPLASDFFSVKYGSTIVGATVTNSSATSATVEVQFPVIGSSTPDILVLRNRETISNWSFPSVSVSETAEVELVVLNASTTDSFRVSATISSGSNAFSVSADALSQPLDAGAEATIKVSTRSGLTAGQSYDGVLTLSGTGAQTVTIPLKVRVVGTRYIISQPDPTDKTKFKVSGGGLSADLNTQDPPEGPVTGLTISEVLDYILNDSARGSGVLIQFGRDLDSDGEIDETINFESAVRFDDAKWGNVDLQGNVSSTNNEGQGGAIFIGEDVFLTSFANITGAYGGDSNVIFSKSSKGVSIEGGTLLSNYGTVINNNGSGKVSVKSGATVRTLTKAAIYNNNAEGEVEIDGGTVEATVGRAIDNISTGTVTVKSGTVRALQAAGAAIRNGAGGHVVVSGGLVTSETTIGDRGTIILDGYNVTADDDEEVETLLTISGGTVENKVNNGYAVYNDTTGKVVVSNGKVQAFQSGGVGIYNNNLGSVDITGGSVEIEAGLAAVYLGATTTGKSGLINISGGEVKATTGRAIYSIGNAERSDTGDDAENRKPMITVSGGLISSRNSSDTQGTIQLAGGGTADYLSGGEPYYEYIGLVISGEATVENTSYTGHTVVNDSKDNVYIEGGKVSAYAGYAVDNKATDGKVFISGGEVSVSDGRAVNNRSKVTVSGEESVKISGGKVSAVDGIAVYNAIDGLIVITGTEAAFVAGTDTKVTSANTKNSQGTIFLEDGTTSTTVRLQIDGGEISNTSTGNAIYNASVGYIKIEGHSGEEDNGADEPPPESYPWIWVTSGSAIFNNKGGYLDILKGSRVSATTGIAVNNITGDSAALDPGRYGIVVIRDEPGEDDEMGYDEYFAIPHRTQVTATSGKAVYTGGSGATLSSGASDLSDGKFNVVIAGGLVSTEGGVAVDNQGVSSKVVILTEVYASPDPDGFARTKISATTGIAINSVSIGYVLVIGHPLVTSKNTTVRQGTVVVADIGGFVGRFSVYGGQVVNDNGGVAIYNRSRGQVYIDGESMQSAVLGGDSQDFTRGGQVVVKAEVISNNGKASEGTIVVDKIANATPTEIPLFIVSGNVYNSRANGNAIYNGSIATVQIGDLEDRYWGFPSSNHGPANLLANVDEDEGYTAGIWVHVDKESGIAVYNADNGNISIEGGTVEATGPSSNKAVYNAAGGQVWIMGSAPAYPANASEPPASGTLVEVTGSTSYAVWNNAGRSEPVDVVFDSEVIAIKKPSVSIFGGHVKGTTASTVWNNADGTIFIGRDPDNKLANPVFRTFGTNGTTLLAAAIDSGSKVYDTDPEDADIYVGATDGVAVNNHGRGAVIVTGGKIESGVATEEEDFEGGKPGIAVYNSSFGKVGIIRIRVEASGVGVTDKLWVTSKNPNAKEGTIYVGSTQGDTKGMLFIASYGGSNPEYVRLENEGWGGNVICQESHGYIKIGTAFGISNDAGSVFELGIGKIGMTLATGDTEYNDPKYGYALKVNNNSAIDFVKIGQNTPNSASGRVSLLGIAAGTNIGVVKGTKYAYTASNGAVASVGIEENP